MSYPPISAAESRAQTTFAALLWALSYPGRVRTLHADGAFAAVAEALLDLETSYYCADPALDRQLVLAGARPAAPEAAQYQFYPTLRDADLDALRAAPAGSYLYPDDAATLIIGCAIGSGQQLAWSGPGIPERQVLLIDGLPHAFWQLRAERIVYPQGWDVVLACGTQIIGLPRTTMVEVL